MTRLPPHPARSLALDALSRFERTGARPDETIERLVRRTRMEDRDRRLAANLVLGVIRHRRLLDHLLDRHLASPGNVSAAARNILRVGAFQILFLDRIPDSAAVHSSVGLAKERLGSRLAPLVNAVLRRVQEAGLEDPPGDPAVLHSYPDWMARRWAERFGSDGAERLMAAMNEPPPLTARVNTLLADREEASARLAAEGARVMPCRYSPVGLVMESSEPFTSLASFGRGLFSIQDEAFQLVGLLLPLSPGAVVLDAFAGVGGKSTHLAQRLGGSALVAAADRSISRLALLAGETRRLGTGNVSVAAADAHSPPWRDGSFDAVLLDVPCTGTGVIRRRPDIKWRRRPEDVGRMASLQLELLERAAPLVAPGGHLLYATCSLEPEENEGVVMRFLDKCATFRLLDLRREGSRPGSSGSEEGGTASRPAHDFCGDDGIFRALPHEHGTDGAGAALLQRTRSRR